MASSLEGNKLIAAVLTGGIIVVGSGVLSKVFYGPEQLKESVVKVDTSAFTGGGAATAETAAVEPIPVRLASADLDKGQAYAKACTSCHAFDKDGANRIGPALWGIVERDIAAHEGYEYSTALSGKEGGWTFAALDGFLEAPKQWAPGTKMSYAGIGDPVNRANVIEYLRSLADTPVAKPEAEVAATPADAEADPKTGPGGQGDSASPAVGDGGNAVVSPAESPASPAQSAPAEGSVVERSQPAGEVPTLTAPDEVPTPAGNAPPPDPEGAPSPAEAAAPDQPASTETAAPAPAETAAPGDGETAPADAASPPSSDAAAPAAEPAPAAGQDSTKPAP